MAARNKVPKSVNHDVTDEDGVDTYEISITLPYLIEGSSIKELSVFNSVHIQGWRH